MASAFETWTVLDNQPIKELSPHLLRVEGKMPGGKVQRAMLVARNGKGGLLIHNAIALSEDEMKRLEAFGRPEVLVVPNGFHRQDAKIYKARYPELKVICPSGARKRVEKVIPVDTTDPGEVSDEIVQLEYVAGLKKAEFVLSVRSGNDLSLGFCDALLNMPKRTGMAGLFLAPTGTLSVPRVMRIMSMNDRGALANHLELLSQAPGLARVCVGHGATAEEAPSAALLSARQILLG